MKTYYLNFTKKGNAIFINEDNKNDKIKANELMRFNTCWTSKKEAYKEVESFFDSCNCFFQNSYSIDFYQLSECGEMLTNFSQDDTI
jgi:hypothetical protein